MARILIIDDEDSVRLALQRMIEWDGHEVAVAADGEQGVALNKEQPADLIITDMIMPGRHGIDVIAEIRRTHPDVSIVAISGGKWRNNVDYLPIARKLGVRTVMDKPFEMSELLRVVRESLASPTPIERAARLQ